MTSFLSRYLNRFGSYYDPSKFGVTKTGYPNFGFPNIYDAIGEELDARKELKDILKTGNRIPVGKSGLSYELKFDSNQLNEDRLFEDNGVKILVDKKSLLYLVKIALFQKKGFRLLWKNLWTQSFRFQISRKHSRSKPVNQYTLYHFRWYVVDWR